MDGFIKMLLEQAVKDGKVQVIHVGEKPDEKNCEPKYEVDVFAEAKKEAQEIAALNRILVDAHIEAGFDECDAVEFALAILKAENN